MRLGVGTGKGKRIEAPVRAVVVASARTNKVFGQSHCFSQALIFSNVFFNDRMPASCARVASLLRRFGGALLVSIGRSG
jgi:hypothetical protein